MSIGNNAGLEDKDRKARPSSLKAVISTVSVLWAEMEGSLSRVGLLLISIAWAVNMYIVNI